MGCADHTVADDGDGSGSGSGEGSGSQEPQPDPKLDASGTYRVRSTFDIATNMPGTAGTIVNGLIEATDDPDDPMSWVLDQMLAQMQPGTLKDILVGAKPVVAGYLNDELMMLAPDLVGTLTEVGQRMGDLTKEFGVNEKLTVGYIDQTYVGRIVVDGVRFKVDTNFVDVAFADHDIDDVVVESVFVGLENESKLNIGEHTVALPYGQIVRLGLDTAIIPAIDPTAHDLSDLLDDLVNCQAVGAELASSLGFGSASFWTGACNAGLDGAANALYEQLVPSSSVLELHLTGTCRASDSNDDWQVDKLASGYWSGTMTYDATDAQLAQPATFSGTRL
ncbi:MAG: hypothetical protein HOV81_29830 [Kofleriaceae bacterium]|nr:hypothetical protein [Kofleriaceae bacterium]